MDIKAILRKHGIEESSIDMIAENINNEIPKNFVSKTQYNKKIGKIDELENNIADLEAKLANADTDEYKNKYEETTKAFEDFKKELEMKEVNKNKEVKILEGLKDIGFNEKIIKLISKDISLDNIELNDDGIKDWDNIIKPYKDEYSDFIQSDKINGATPGVVINNNQEKSEVNPLADALSKYL